MSLSSFASAVLRGMIQTAIPLRTHFALKVIGAIALWVVGRALISTEVEAQLSEFACSRAEAAVQPVNPCRPPHEFAIGSAQRPEDRLWPDQGRRVTASSGFRMAYTRSGFCGARPGIATGAGLTEEIDDHVDATQPVEPRHERTRTSTSPCPHQPPHRELSPAHFRSPGEKVAVTPTRRHWTSVQWTSVPWTSVPWTSVRYGRRYEAVGQLVVAASPTPGEFASVRPHP
jgi:hypothetical protein